MTSSKETDLEGKIEVTAVAYYSKDESLGEHYYPRLREITGIFKQANKAELLIRSDRGISHFLSHYHLSHPYMDLQSLTEKHPELGEKLQERLEGQELKYAHIFRVISKDKPIEYERKQYESILHLLEEKDIIYHSRVI